MRLSALTLLLLALSAKAAAGQTLDIGGVDLHLGQSLRDALTSLATYDVKYSESLKAWFVTQRVGGRIDWLGHFSVIDGRISLLSKGYSSAEEADTPQTYTRAWQDVHQRGGNSCRTRNVEYTDGLVHEIETRCGAYRLVYTFPMRSDDGVIDAGISVTVQATR